MTVPLSVDDALGPTGLHLDATLTLPSPELLGVWIADQSYPVQAWVLAGWLVEETEPGTARLRTVQIGRQLHDQLAPVVLSDLCTAVETLLHTLRGIDPKDPR